MNQIVAGTCVPCTGLLANAEFKSGGMPYNRDTCLQTCKAGHYAVGRNPLQECRVCSSSACPVGFTRGNCAEDADGLCVPCSIPKPTLSHFISAGPECRWECDSGFELNANLGACLPPKKAGLLIVNRSLSTWEDDEREPASFRLVLSKQPSTQSVKVVLTAFEQLHHAKPSLMTFTPGT
jgi:hypothetical protein